MSSLRTILTTQYRAARARMADATQPALYAHERASVVLLAAQIRALPKTTKRTAISSQL